MRKRLMSLVVVFALVIGVLPGVGPVPAAAAVETSYSKKQLTAYQYNKDKKTTIDALFTTELPEVPFVDVVAYLNNIYAASFTEKSLGGDQYEVKSGDAVMVADVNRDTLAFDCFYSFEILTVNREGNVMTEGFPSRPNTAESTISKVPVTLDMSKYSIDIVAQEDHLYMPLPTLNDLFLITNNVCRFIDGSLYFDHSINNAAGEPVYYADVYSKLFETTECSKALGSFNFRELCFVIDTMFGCPERAQIAPSIEKLGLEKTLDSSNDAVMQKVKQMLQSTSRVDQLIALLALDAPFFDGGHTALAQEFKLALNKSPTSPLCTAVVERVKSDKSDPVIQQMLQSMAATEGAAKKTPGLTDARTAAFSDYTVLKEWGGGLSGLVTNPMNSAALLTYGDMALFSFGTFSLDTTKVFKEALDLAKEKGMKRFIIDVTSNNGGLTDMVSFVMTILNNSLQNTHSYTYALNGRDVVSGSLAKTAQDYDLNLDGVYDDKDKEVRYDFDFAVLTSAGSYSSANLLPCLAHEIGIPVFGERSGGGACVMTVQYMSDYLFNQIAGPVCLLYADGKTSVEAGAPLSMDLLKTAADGTKDYSDFFNPQILSQAMDKYSLKHQSITATAKTKSVKAKKLKKTKVTIKNAIKLKGAQGKVTYTCSKRNSENISISQKGVITIKKGTYKKGKVLNIKVLVNAEGGKGYRPATATVMVQVKIK